MPTFSFKLAWFQLWATASWYTSNATLKNSLVPAIFIQWRHLFTTTSLFIILMWVEWPPEAFHTGIFIINQIIFWLFSLSSFIWPTNGVAAACHHHYCLDSMQPIFLLLGAEEQELTDKSFNAFGRKRVKQFSHQEPAARCWAHLFPWGPCPHNHNPNPS